MQRLISCAFLALAAIAGAALAQTGSPGTIVVRVPADATVTIGGEKTTQRGGERRFLSPALAPGTYSYEIEARWTEGGKEVKVTKSVTFDAGKTVTVDLRTKKQVKTEVSSKPLPKGDKEPKKIEKKKVIEKKVEKKVEKKKEAPPTAAGDAGFVSLFNGKDLSGWKTVPEKGEPFSVKDGAIVVAGKPAGYFYTDKSYKNYILRYDWKFIKNGNSGLLVHITGKHQVWPKSVEVQGMQTDHGHIFAIGGAKGKFETNRENQKKAIKLLDWNTTEIISKDGEISSSINGLPISTGKADLTEGPFGFQSEGTELHFKNIRIKVLSDSAPSPKKSDVPEKKKSAQEAKLSAAAISAVAVAAGDAWKDLFNGKNMDGWKFHLDPKAKDADPLKTFAVKDGEIQVSGFPFGYFYTDKSYKNYVLTYDWTFPKDQPDKTTMNTGLLVHIQLPHTKGAWPKSVEPQGRYKDHGKFFFIGFGKESKTEQKFDEAAQQKALKPSHEWNTTEVTCKADGSVSVKINGTPVNQGKSELTQGPIGFQSEGARIHFKNIKIKMMD